MVQIRGTAFLSTLSNSLIEAVTAVEEAVVVLITHEAAARCQRPNRRQAASLANLIPKDNLAAEILNPRRQAASLTNGHLNTTDADMELPQATGSDKGNAEEGSGTASEPPSTAPQEV